MGNNASISFCNFSYKITVIAEGSETIVNNCNFSLPAGPTDAFTNYSLDGIDATNNYWTTVDTTTIASEIYDFYDNGSLGIVTFEPLQVSTVTAAGPR